MSQGKEENLRRRFRIYFPPDLMLKATINGFAYDVVEVAELSIVVTATNVINQNGTCAGSIEWNDGRCQKFSGKIGRLSNLGRVIDQIEGITVEEVLKEQRRLLRKFPRLKGEPSELDDLQRRHRLINDCRNTMKRNEVSNRRSVFRLRLPDDALLAASINGQTFEVIEIAESSLVVTAREVENQNGVCRGSVQWSDGTSSEFIGQSGRLSQLGRVIWSVQGIRMRDVIGEQRRLISRFPAFYPLRKTS